MEKEYVHPEIGPEFEAISGRYYFSKEAALKIDGREVLYFVGVGVFDSTCCGSGGCGYAVAPGYLVERNIRTSENGAPVSKVIPITDRDEQKRIEAAIKEREQISQVNFL